MKCIQAADMHCDTLSALQYKRRKGETVHLRKNSLHIDLEKLRKGGYVLQTFAIFTALEERDPLETALEQADIFYREMEAGKDLIAPVTRMEQADRNMARGKISALLSLEGGDACKGNLSILRNFYRLGVRMLTLTWNDENELGYPQTPRNRQKFFLAENRQGLKEAGFAFLDEMERLGMIVDVSHLSDNGFYDVLEHTRRPFTASHSNARALAAHPRNLTDSMLKSLADRGGVAGVNFYGLFLSDRYKSGCQKISSNEAVIRQIRHMTNVGGMAGVGLGTDFDGFDGPVEIENCSGMQKLAEDMERAGFTAGEIEGVFYKNVMNLYREILG